MAEAGPGGGEDLVRGGGRGPEAYRRPPSFARQVQKALHDVLGLEVRGGVLVKRGEGSVAPVRVEAAGSPGTGGVPRRGHRPSAAVGPEAGRIRGGAVVRGVEPAGVGVRVPAAESRSPQESRIGWSGERTVRTERGAVSLSFSGASVVGMERDAGGGLVNKEVNADASLAWVTPEGRVLVVVADGAGSNKNAPLLARNLVGAVARLGVGAGAIEMAGRLTERQTRGREASSTLVAAELDPDTYRLRVSYVGDSRMVVWRPGGFADGRTYRQITADQDVAHEAARRLQGRLGDPNLTTDDAVGMLRADVRSKGNVLTAAVTAPDSADGQVAYVEGDVSGVGPYEVQVRPGDVLVAISDGVMKLRNIEIAKIVAEAVGKGEGNISGRIMEAMAKKLAGKAPGRIDDATVVTMRIGDRRKN